GGRRGWSSQGWHWRGAVRSPWCGPRGRRRSWWRNRARTPATPTARAARRVARGHPVVRVPTRTVRPKPGSSRTQQEQSSPATERRSSVEDPGQIIGVIIIALVAVFVIVAIAKSIKIVPQAGALIVERLGRYQSTMYAGLHFLIPFVDRVRSGVDLRERVVPFQPQPVITSDNLV